MKLPVLICAFIFTAALVSLFVGGCTSSEQPRPINLTGTWKTESSVPYIMEHTHQKSLGRRVEFDELHLLERLTKVTWTLTQRSDGLITGMNHWIAYNENGEYLYEGKDPMVGAINDNRLILVEVRRDVKKSPQVLFEGTLENHHMLKCIGYDVQGEKSFVMRFDLVREN